MKNSTLFIVLLFILNQATGQVNTLFFDDFETGQWSSNWTPQANLEGEDGGRVEIVAGQGISSTNCVFLGRYNDGGYTRTGLDLRLSLAGKSDVYLSFNIRDFYEDFHAQDGIFISNDGGANFHQVYTFNTHTWCDNTWGTFPPFSIDEFAASANLTLNDQFVIRFQQYDNADFSTYADEDGFIIDNVHVYTRPPQYATLPFSDNFDATGVLGANWSWAHPDNTMLPISNVTKPTGQVNIVNGQGTGGTFGLMLGKHCSDGLSANAIDLNLNLLGESDVFLTFNIRDFHEENHSQDAIYLSNDGGKTFHKVYTLAAQSWCDNVWGTFPPFSIDKLAASANLAYTNKFVIRFQQYDDADFDTYADEDGFIIDNVNVYARPPKYASLPFYDNFDETGTLSDSWSWSHADDTVFPLVGTTKTTGLVAVANGQGTSGTFGLMMGKLWGCRDGFTTNALDLHLNLANQSDVFLAFSIRDFYEENHNQDGIYFSNDGGLNFHQVYTFVAQDWCDNTWGYFPPFSVDELATTVSLDLTDNFIIRFQQYDNADFDTYADEDGFVLDNVSVYTRPPQYATLPFHDNFDNGTGVIGESWSWSQGDDTVFPIEGTTRPTGFVAIANEQGTNNSFGLMMGKLWGCSDGFTTNALDLHLNLANQSDVFLSFDLRDFYEETHVQDALFFSEDGGTTFHKVYSFRPQDWCDNLWGRFPPFSIDKLAADAGLSLTDKFVIRFQQYDNADFNTYADEDGFVLDNVSVYSQSPRYAGLPFEENFDDGTGILSPNWAWSHADNSILPLTNTTKPTGYVGILNENGIDNSFALLIGKRWGCADGFTSNAVDLFLNLEGQSNVILDFSIRDFWEENHIQDGIYFSNDDGDTFKEIHRFDFANIVDNVFINYPTLKLDSLVALVDLVYTDKCIIRFQQYDDADFNTYADEDGFILDNIKVRGSSTTSTKQLPLNTSIQLYPNPAKDYISIDSSSALHDAMVSIYSLSGQLLQKMKVSNKKIYVSNLNPGMYVLQLESEEEKIYKKFIKQ